MRHLPVLVFVCLAPVLCCGPAASLDIEVTLEPGQTGVPVPVSVDVSRWLDSEAPSRSWCLVDRESGEPVACQLDAGRLEFLVEAPVSDRVVRRSLSLTPGTPPDADSVRVEHTEGKRLMVVDGERRVLVYNYRTVLPEGLAPDRAHSCYIHPVYGLGGEVLTGDFEEDHPHHRGIAWMSPRVEVEGKRYDIWHLRGIRPRFAKVLSMESGPVCGLLKVTSHWCLDESGESVLDETLTVRVYRAGSRGRIVDIEFVLDPTEKAVTLGSSDTGYGGMNVRFGPREETRLHTSSGRLEKDCDRERFFWSDLSARFGGSSEFSGVAVFDHPGNPSHPCGWTNRFYGVLNPSFTAVAPVAIQPDKPLKVRYRLWLHRGDVGSGASARAYEAYVHPPEVKVLPHREGG